MTRNRSEEVRITPASAAGTPSIPFAAFRVAGYRAHFATYLLAMMADNIEHVISYWIAYQTFHSAALGGFAVLSHWLPFLLLSVPMGALADRVDPRRMIQCGMVLFMAASLGWGYLFLAGGLQMWHAMLLLVLHGCAGVLWQTSSQLLLHDIVEPALMPSAVRLNATARTLGVLVGPAVGGALLLLLGPAFGILLNAAFYLPLVLWLWKAPYGPRFRPRIAPTRPLRGYADIARTVREVAGLPVIVSMTVLAGATSFFIGNSYQALMPAFAHGLGRQEADVAYSALLAADAAGALIAGFVLERWGRQKSSPRTAILLALGWCLTLGLFALTRVYSLALALLFAAGFLELSFSSMAQSIVQVNAPAAMRGSVIGLFNMSSLGLRAFSGVTVGIVGASIGVHWSLSLAAACLFVALLTLRIRATRLVDQHGGD